MGVTDERPPEGRYGRDAGARADRGLRIVGSVLGAALLALVGWFGYDYVAGQKVSAELIKFDVVAADRVEVHLEVRKADGAKGYCTVRALAESGTEVGRREFRFDQAAPRLDQVVTLRTTKTATAAQLLGCTSD
ncbi:DUF4307 domain-containing protein [Streptomyces somaliensis]|uniref:DUF4307 domain-containing protein n=1 Tax=Streptomyces somaliensis (strain ATCC 33201 / DSM 40738 / JCM 12659 / KCTC 9044 / NCTC 11332 / NRRL B-12077 / IP 733) TaxID=1134445 RepID=A0AA44IC72_STRE0|nr:DUF4307 domain-containing protein [Streptomyces somaliensis]MCP9944805.1 DUF4307 domain-containing protein [Streptomyces somaliensis]MCP9961968.1 DUF4307 domain-containing protein [Streptomyces somaliensis]MCP9974789.1 DUF4307 domain-containing protein [Streptomyces somaliensis]MCQ0023947.1 DUF4307 domain-containing protein [Streptomyces somaliensis DSM 40738]NKY13102.1 DUF4307 domain-containing protein [Streptomyces somaliensis DSM 40738]